MKGRNGDRWYVQCDECHGFLPDVDEVSSESVLAPLLVSARQQGWTLNQRDLCRICTRTAHLAHHHREKSHGKAKNHHS